MIGGVLRYMLAVMIGAAIGLGSALYLAGLWPGAKPLDFGDVDVGGWRSDFAIASKNADPYTRARVARHGLLALAKSEAVYFTRTSDSDGNPLSAACEYRISGGAMPAHWWSITLYDALSKLPMNKDGALSIDATSITGAPDDWSVLIAPERPAPGADWISSRNAGNFDLTLRLYLPADALLADPESALNPPVVQQLSCNGDAP